MLVIQKRRARGVLSRQGRSTSPAVASLQTVDGALTMRVSLKDGVAEGVSLLAEGVRVVIGWPDCATEGLEGFLRLAKVSHSNVSGSEECTHGGHHAKDVPLRTGPNKL